MVNRIVWTRLSLKVKLTAFVVAVIALASYTFGRFAFDGLVEMLQKATGQGAITAAQGLAETIDAQWLMNLKSYSDPEYLAIHRRFQDMFGKGLIHRMEIVRYIDNFKVEHILNLPADGTSDYYPPGVLEDAPPGTLYAETTPGYSGVKLSHPGAYMAGWVLIQHQGQNVGMFIVIMDGNDVQRAIDKVWFLIIMTLFGFVIASGILSYKLAASFEKTAVTDGLMGIYNHKFFKQRLEQEVAKSRRYGQQTALVLLDIDFFKRVNDTYGHATGDITLKCLAKWVSDTVRTTDIVARYGGEEIAIILPFTGLAGAQEFAERLRLKISHEVVKDPGEKAEFRVTVSIGVAQWEKGVDMIELIKRTDSALYHSKRNGRNQVTIYQEDLVPAPAPMAAPVGR